MLVWFSAYGFIPVIIFGILSDKFQRVAGTSAALLARCVNKGKQTSVDSSGVDSGGIINLTSMVQSQATTVIA
jgi:hypothetical protein